MARPGTMVRVENIENVGVGGFVPIRLKIACSSVVIKARVSTTVLYFYQYLSEGIPADANIYFTIPAGTSLTIEVNGKEKDTCIGFVRTASGIDVLEVLYVG